MRTAPPATIARRIARLETARRIRPDPEAAAAFARLVAQLDTLAARKASRDPTAQTGIGAMAAVCRGAP
jgi:putative hemolysin